MLALRMTHASATAAAELPCAAPICASVRLRITRLLSPPSGRIRHHRQIVLLAPWEKITLNGAIIETVRDPIRRASITVWDTEESFHLASVEVGHALSWNFPRRAQLFETRYNVGELGVGDWRVQQIEIEIVSADREHPPFK